METIDRKILPPETVNPARQVTGDWKCVRKMSGLGKTTINNLRREGAILSRLVGKRRLYFLDSVEAFLLGVPAVDEEAKDRD